MSFHFWLSWITRPAYHWLAEICSQIKKGHLQSCVYRRIGALPSGISSVSCMVGGGCHGLVSCSTTVVACAEEGVHQSKMVCTKATFVLDRPQLPGLQFPLMQCRNVKTTCLTGTCSSSLALQLKYSSHVSSQQTTSTIINLPPCIY